MLKKSHVPSIKEIAKLAGCSPSTVSNVLNSKGLFSEKTREKVLKICREKNYRRNISARNLRIGKLETVGLIFSRISADIFKSAFYIELIYSLQKRLAELNYDLLLSEYSPNAESDDSDLPRLLRLCKTDGVVLLGGMPASLTRRLKEMSLNALMLDSNCDDLDSITSDNFEASRKMTDILASLGHKHITYFAYDYEDYNTDMRIKGFLEGARLNGQRADIVRNFLTLEDAGKQFGKMFSSPDAPTAIMCVNDELALSILEKAQSMGLKIPEDLSLFGYDDTIYSTIGSKKISTSHVDLDEMGTCAANIIVERIQNPSAKARQITLPTRIIERDTCAPAKS